MDSRIREWLQDILDQANKIQSFTEGMSFDYVGDNNFIDHMINEGIAFYIFNNLNNHFIKFLA